MKSEIVTVRLSSAMKKRLKELAEATDRTPAYLASQAIESYVASQQWQVNAIQQGVDAAARGEFASQERVRKAFKKWGLV